MGIRQRILPDCQRKILVEPDCNYCIQRRGAYYAGHWVWDQSQMENCILHWIQLHKKFDWRRIPNQQYNLSVSSVLYNKIVPFIGVRGEINEFLGVVQLSIWTDNSFEVVTIKSNFRFSIDKTIRENRITIPFPQGEIHIKSQIMT